jgi:hypothetical protein
MLYLPCTHDPCIPSVPVTFRPLGRRVWVLTGMGTGSIWNTHGLPVPLPSGATLLLMLCCVIVAVCRWVLWSWKALRRLEIETEAGCPCWEWGPSVSCFKWGKCGKQSWTRKHTHRGGFHARFVLLEIVSINIQNRKKKHTFWGIGTIAHPLPQLWLPVFLVVAVHLHQRCAGGVLTMLTRHPVTDLPPTQTVSMKLSNTTKIGCV